MNLDIYWHIYLVNHWRDIVEEQLALLLETGLAEFTDHIYISIIDPDGKFPELASILMEMDKVIMVQASNHAKDYEFPTLQKIHLDSRIGYIDDFVLYMHTKGVSYEDDCHKPWREVCHETLKNWQDIIHQMRHRGCDVGGINYLPPLPEGDRWRGHFSGNFWIARRNYLATLERPQHSDDRFQAEWWICSGNPNIYSLPFQEHGCKST